MGNTIQQKLEQRFGVSLREITQKVSIAYVFVFVLLELIRWLPISYIVDIPTHLGVLYYLFLLISLLVFIVTLTDLHKRPFSVIGFLAFLISVFSTFFTLNPISVFKIAGVVVLFCYGIISLSSESIIRKIFAWLLIVVSLVQLIVLIIEIVRPLSMRVVI